MLPKIDSISQVALFLDFDGTLVDLASTPDAVDVKPELKQLINELFVGTHGALAIITGRNLESLDELLALPDIPTSGSHGAEWRFADGVFHSASDDLLLPDKLVFSCEQFSQEHQLIFERKGYSIAIHYRNQIEIEAPLRKFLIQEISRYPSLCLQEGKCVIEIKPSSINKGIALARFMSAPPFLNRRAWYFGDDRTDEAAFEWVNRNNGVSVKIGEGKTKANFHLESPIALAEFLGELLDIKESK